MVATANVYPLGLEMRSKRRFACDALRNYRLLWKDDEEYLTVQRMVFEGHPMDPSLDSCLGMVLGNIVG